ncbi:MAG TPA: S1/P1 nuclease [Blastocatellia bacterium]|nr:S1/P1 nuclease [Blastocatellia bacterium]
MRKKRWSSTALQVLSIVLVLGFVPSSFGWGAGGHMMVASIAYSRLNSRAKAEVDRLIAIEIEPKSITEKSRDFMDAGHWADDIRSDQKFKFAAVLHYIDQPIAGDDTPVPANLSGKDNIVTALTHYVHVLKTSENAADQAEALRFIIHFVGDIHQPLHCATLVTKKNPEGDRGGNLFHIETVDALGNNKQGELHAYWDSGIGDFPKSGPNYSPPSLSEIPAAVSKVLASNPDSDPRWKQGGPFDFAQWAAESKTLAETVAYKGVSPGEVPSAQYNEAALKVARQRVAWAGYRLAALLNAIWPETK